MIPEIPPRRKLFRRRSKETNQPMPLEEFMEIRDFEQAKSVILDVSRYRFSHESRFSPEEIEKRINYVAYTVDYANDKHAGKNRLTGEPYIFHPLAVTYMGAVDKQTPIDELHIELAASANHDVLEDTSTLPSKMRTDLGDEFGAEVTKDVITLSKKIKVFEDNSGSLKEELTKIGEVYPSLDEIELQKWAKRQKQGSKLFKTRIYLNNILHSSARVRKIKLRDRKHNLMTLPSLEPPPGVIRTEKEQQKINHLWEVYETKNQYRKIAISLGITGAALAISLRNIYIGKYNTNASLNYSFH